MTICCLLATGGAAISQESAAHEGLTWLPDAIYEHIAYVDLAGIRRADAGSGFRELFNITDRTLLAAALPLPQEVLDRSEYVISARTLSEGAIQRITALLNTGLTTPDDAPRSQKRSAARSERLSKLKIVDTMFVISSSEASLIVEDLVRSNLLARTGKRIGEQAVYAVTESNNRDRADTRHGQYLWPSPSGELLIAHSTQTLQHMADAGGGTGLQMMENQDYAEALHSMTESGQAFSIRIGAVAYKQIFQMLEDMGTPPESLRQTIGVRNREKAYSIHEYRISDLIIARVTDVYISESVAQTRFTEQKNVTGLADSDERIEHVDVYRDGSRVVTHITMSHKAVESSKEKRLRRETESSAPS